MSGWPAFVVVVGSFGRFCFVGDLWYSLVLICICLCLRRSSALVLSVFFVSVVLCFVRIWMNWKLICEFAGLSCFFVWV